MEGSMAYAVPDSLRRIARQLRTETEEYGRHVSDDLRERGPDTRKELKRLWSQLEDLVEHRARPAMRDVSREGGRYLRGGRDAALDATDRLRYATREHPLLAIGIAVAATWAVASLLSRRR
jgi:ElaB/YqjD/DUF883 family membrane-anchored ribosome-binding protein